MTEKTTTPKWREQTTEEKKESRRKFLLEVFKPAELQEAYDVIDRHASETGKKAEDYAQFGLDLVKADTPTMERIIETYMPSEFLAGFMLANSIRVIEGKDSRYFEELYNNLVEQLQGDPSYDGFTPVDKPTGRVGCGEKSEARAAAISRVTNQDFLKRVVEEVPDNCYFGYESPQAIAAGRITDQTFLERILSTKTDSYIVEAAIGQLTNRTLLKKYANRPNQECDQYKYEPGSPAQTEAFHKKRYRDAAKQRLKSVGGFEFL